MPYTGKVNVPPGTPRIALCVRMVDGCPLLFTDRGEVVTGQRLVTVSSGIGRVTSVTAEIYVERELEKLPGCLQS